MDRNITTKPFLSRRQLRKCYALRRAGLRSWDCDKWAKETGNIRKLPDTVSEKGYDSIIYGLWPDVEPAVKIDEIAREYIPDDSSRSQITDLHLTLQFVGDHSKYIKQIDQLVEAQLNLALFWISTYGCNPITGIVNGYGRFSSPDGELTPVYLTVDSQGLSYLRESICRTLTMLGVESDTNHGFIPHITIGYIPSSDSTPDIKFDPFPISFSKITLACGDHHIDIPLTTDKYDNPSLYVTGKSVWSTAFVNDLPDSSFLFIESGGKKDKDNKTIPRSKRHFPFKDANGRIDLPHLRNAIARIPQSNAPGLNKDSLQKRARKMLMSSNKDISKLTVFKDARGDYRWVLYSSNPYKDRDEEFVTLLAHERDIADLERTKEYGPLRWWHEGKPYFEKPGDWRTVKPGPGLDLGMCDFAAMHGRIRIESGTFKSKKIGMVFQRHADKLEVSQSFSHPEDEPDDGNGFLHIKTFERSLTPRGEASNLFTGFMVSAKEYRAMDPKRRAALQALGVDIEEVEEGAEQLQAKADKTRTPMREKAIVRRQAAIAASAADDDDDDDKISLSAKLDSLTAQMEMLTAKMSEEVPDIQEERLEDLMVGELTVGEFQDMIKGTISRKSLEPIGVAMRQLIEEMAEIKEILTSKSVQSVVDEVGRMKAKIERLQARTKGIGSKVRELADEEPRGVQRKGVRPSEDDSTIFDEIDDAELAQKSTNNPFSWLDDFVQRP